MLQTPVLCAAFTVTSSKKEISALVFGPGGEEPVVDFYAAKRRRRTPSRGKIPSRNKNTLINIRVSNAHCACAFFSVSRVCDGYEEVEVDANT